MKPRAIVLEGLGLNCQDETKSALYLAGAEVDGVHLNDLKNLRNYQILAIPGGFSGGDNLEAGRFYANKIRFNLWDEILEFIEKGGIGVGICNGAQILTKLGLLPAGGDYGPEEITPTINDSARYECRGAFVTAASKKCIWTNDAELIYMPVAHSEGKFYTSDEVADKLIGNDQVALRYVVATPEDLYLGDEHNELADGRFPHNPNGSIDDIAGICDPTGRFLALMPHPERALRFTQVRGWTRIKSKLRREGKQIPQEGPGLIIFKNGVDYFN